MCEASWGWLDAGKCACGRKLPCSHAEAGIALEHAYIHTQTHTCAQTCSRPSASSKVGWLNDPREGWFTRLLFNDEKEETHTCRRSMHLRRKPFYVFPVIYLILLFMFTLAGHVTVDGDWCCRIQACKSFNLGLGLGFAVPSCWKWQEMIGQLGGHREQKI